MDEGKLQREKIEQIMQGFSKAGGEKQPATGLR